MLLKKLCICHCYEKRLLPCHCEICVSKSRNLRLLIPTAHRYSRDRHVASLLAMTSRYSVYFSLKMSIRRVWEAARYEDCKQCLLWTVGPIDSAGRKRNCLHAARRVVARCRERSWPLLQENVSFLRKFSAHTIVPARGTAIAVPYNGVCRTERQIGI